MSVSLRALQADDADALLAFERANRAWFERTVEARAPSFYTLSGIRDHVGDYLQALRRRDMFPGLLVDGSGIIIGRANLRNIDVVRRTGEIGYRIGEAFCGQGNASLAVAYLKTIARDAWRLRSLDAYVTTENPASMRVLEKSGFVRGALVEGHATVGGRSLDSVRFRCQL